MARGYALRLALVWGTLPLAVLGGVSLVSPYALYYGGARIV